MANLYVGKYILRKHCIHFAYDGTIYPSYPKQDILWETYPLKPMGIV